jgi:hypothetical protein
VLAGACRLAAADHERLGDEAYREARFGDALAEYQAAQRAGARSRTWAKAGAAALHARDYRAATDAFRSLAESDPTRATESAVGLERVVEATRREDRVDPGTAARAVLALRAVSPNRPLGRLAQFPLATVELEARELLGMLPPALAAAATPSAVDSLLVRYADVLRATTACEGAVLAYQAVLRRADRGPLRASARRGLADCGLLLGLDALAGQRGEAAERWFDAVLAVESSSQLAWRAQIGRGDARLLLGDALGASVAYQAVLGGAGVPDSVRALAASRLNALAQAPPAPPGGS